MTGGFYDAGLGQGAWAMHEARPVPCCAGVETRDLGATIHVVMYS